MLNDTAHRIRKNYDGTGEFSAIWKASFFLDYSLMLRQMEDFFSFAEKKTPNLKDRTVSFAADGKVSIPETSKNPSC